MPPWLCQPIQQYKYHVPENRNLFQFTKCANLPNLLLIEFFQLIQPFGGWYKNCKRTNIRESMNNFPIELGTLRSNKFPLLQQNNRITDGDTTMTTVTVTFQLGILGYHKYYCLLLHWWPWMAMDSPSFDRWLEESLKLIQAKRYFALKKIV